MFDLAYNSFVELGLSEKTSGLLTYIVLLAVIALVCYIVHVTGEAIIKRAAKLLVRHRWVETLLERRFFHHLSNLLIPVAITLMSTQLPGHNAVANELMLKLAEVLGAVFAAFLLTSLVDAADRIYHTYEISKVRPLRSLFQVIKVVLVALCALVGFSVLTGQNPIQIIGGIGAVTAIITFIFKDAILGFVSGLQLVGNDLIRIGDSIEVPKYSANGNVTELSITTVKVKNFDGTITSIPAYALMNDAFINWRGVSDSGSRRIKRAIHIDATGIKYLEDGTTTNLTRFREYISGYLKAHPQINQSSTVLVRQLDSDGRGIPLELYAFTNTSAFDEYELIQASIFEHLYAKIAEFGLQVYQCRD